MSDPDVGAIVRPHHIPAEISSTRRARSLQRVLDVMASALTGRHLRLQVAVQLDISPTNSAR